MRRNRDINIDKSVAIGMNGIKAIFLVPNIVIDFYLLVF